MPVALRTELPQNPTSDQSRQEDSELTKLNRKIENLLKRIRELEFVWAELGVEAIEDLKHTLHESINERNSLRERVSNLNRDLEEAERQLQETVLIKNQFSDRVKIQNRQLLEQDQKIRDYKDRICHGSLGFGVAVGAGLFFGAGPGIMVIATGAGAIGTAWVGNTINNWLEPKKNEFKIQEKS